MRISLTSKHLQTKEERSDSKHAKNILERCEMVRCKSLMYDSQAGLWTNNEDQHINIINCLSNDIFPQDEHNENQIVASLFKPAYKLATVMCPIIDKLYQNLRDIS
jgi:hypothetical protein